MALLEIDHVSKRFGGLRAVNDVAFSTDPSSITFIVGPNGAGKTTLFNLITGVFHPDEGRIRFGGADITHVTPNRAARLGIGEAMVEKHIAKAMRRLADALYDGHTSEKPKGETAKSVKEDHHARQHTN